MRRDTRIGPRRRPHGSFNGQKSDTTLSVLLARSISRSPVSFSRTYKQELTFIIKYILPLMRTKAVWLSGRGLSVNAIVSHVARDHFSPRDILMFCQHKWIKEGARWRDACIPEQLERTRRQMLRFYVYVFARWVWRYGGPGRTKGQGHILALQGQQLGETNQEVAPLH